MNDLITNAPVVVSYRIGDWLAHPTARLIERDAHRSSLSPIGMDVLVYLAERPGITVTHEELLAEFWRGPISSTNAVHKCIAELRHALQNGDGTHYIDTVPRRGYRLVAPVQRVETPTGAPVVRNGAAAPAPMQATPPRTRWRWGAILIAFTFAASAALVTRDVPFAPGDERGTLTPRKSIAIATFTTPAGSPADAFLGAGIADAISSALVGSPDYVIKRVRGGEVAAIARESSVSHVLSGAVARDGDRLRVTVAVAEGASGEVLYEAQFDEPAGDIFELEDRIAASVADALSVNLDPNRRAHMIKGGTHNIDAYLAVMEARYYANLPGRENGERALALDRHALTLDPKFADAYMCVAMGLDVSARYQSVDVYDSVVRELDVLAIQAALETPGSGVAHGIALIAAGLTGDLKAQETNLRALIKIHDAPARRFLAVEDLYGGLLRSAGLFEDSKQYSWHWVSRRPEPPSWVWENLHITLWTAGVDTAIARLRAGADAAIAASQPVDISVLSGLVTLLAQERRFDDAQRYLDHLVRADTTGLWAHSGNAVLKAFRGELNVGSTDWQAFVSDPLASHLSVGQVAFILGDIDEGVANWRRLNTAELGLLNENHWFIEYHFSESVRTDPRYRNLLEDLGIGEAWRKRMEAGVRELEPFTGIALAAEQPERVIAGHWRQKL